MRKIWGFVVAVLVFGVGDFVHSKPTFVLEKLDATRYPQIEILLRENRPLPLSPQNLVVAEEMDGARIIPLDLEVQRTSEEEPIQLVVSIQPTDSKAINQWSTDLVLSLSTLLTAKDRMHVHIQEEKRFLYLSNQNTNTLKSGFILPSVETYSRTLESLSVLLDKLSVASKKPPFLLVVLHSQSIPDKDRLVDLAKKSRTMGIPIHILGFPSREAEKLAEYTDGRLYSLKDKESTKKLFEDIAYYKKPPYRISFLSRQKVAILEEKNIQIDIGVLNVQNLTAEYTVSPYTRLESAIKDPFVFLPSAVFILLVCLTALVILPRVRANRNRTSTMDKISRPRSQEEYDEGRVYAEMYGRKDMETPERVGIGVGENDEEEDEDVEPPDFRDTGNNRNYSESKASWETSHQSEVSFPSFPWGGETYQKAVLIQKDGPSPGKQFNLYGHETLIGRLETNHLVVWDTSLSPVHARIKRIQNRFVLYDMLSKTGVYLNGKKLLRPKILQDFDEIQLGRTLFVFRGK